MLCPGRFILVESVILDQCAGVKDIGHYCFTIIVKGVHTIKGGVIIKEGALTEGRMSK